MKKTGLLMGSLLLLKTLSAQQLDEGKSSYFHEHYEKAQHFFTQQLKGQPENAEAWYWLIKSYLADEEVQKAKDSFSLFPASQQQTPWFYLIQGNLLLSGSDSVKAVEPFQKAVDLSKKKDPQFYALAGADLVEAKHGNLSVALDYLEQAIKRDKKNAYVHLARGNAYRKLQNGGEAYKAYREAIDKDPGLAEAYYQLGKLFRSQQNKDLFLENFEKALTVDSTYAPAYYELYTYYIESDAGKALDYFEKFLRHVENPENSQYAWVDVIYLSRDYERAIKEAEKLLEKEGAQVKPRLYKLLAYSYEGIKDSVHAMPYMRNYFSHENDSNFILKDYENMAALYVSENKKDSAMEYLEKATAFISDSATRLEYYRKLADFAKSVKNYAAEAKWLGKFYSNNSRANNVNLFNWGLAAFLARDYKQADSVFGLYAEKYPEQSFGYYWRARTNAAIDTSMAAGLAVPYYEKLIEVIGEDSLSNTDKKWKIEAYGYLAAYETNTEKDFEEAIGYFQKLLQIDPDNTQAKQYMALLEKNLRKEKDGEKSSPDKN